MTADERERLRADVEAATPGPWWTDGRYCGREMGCSVLAARTDSGPLPGNPTRGAVAWATAILNTEAPQCEANARLIAQAPDLARALLDAEDRLARIREILDGDGGFVVATPWRNDGTPSRHDRCVHGRWAYDGCADCLDDALRACLDGEDAAP